MLFQGDFSNLYSHSECTTVPAVLCEIGFLSNDKERGEMLTDSRRQKTAKAIAEGIIEYVKSTTGKK